MSTTKHNDVLTLTVAEERELARIDADGDGTISAEEARAAAKSAVKLRASNSRLWKVVFGVFALLFLSWLGNAGLMVAVVTLSKDLKVEGGSLKNNKNGGIISTVSQKKVYEVTLVSPSRRQLDEQHSGGTNESSTVVAQATCASVMGAISSIEKGNDGSLVKMNLGDGEFWEPRMSAASYHLHESSFGIEQIYLDDQRDVSYDVTCEISKADCENAPGSLCDAVEDAFDGELKVRRRPLKICVKSVDDDDNDDSNNSDQASVGAHPGCECEDTWTRPEDGGTCGTPQQGCPATSCDGGGGWAPPWCSLKATPCMPGPTGDPGADGPHGSYAYNDDDGDPMTQNTWMFCFPPSPPPPPPLHWC